MFGCGDGELPFAAVVAGLAEGFPVEIRDKGFHFVAGLDGPVVSIVGERHFVPGDHAQIVYDVSAADDEYAFVPERCQLLSQCMVLGRGFVDI